MIKKSNWPSIFTYVSEIEVLNLDAKFIFNLSVEFLLQTIFISFYRGLKKKASTEAWRENNVDYSYTQSESKR